MPEATGTLKIMMDVSRGAGEILGGAKTALEGKQGEMPPSKLGMAGAVGIKALTGSQGMGGLKKQLGGMTGPIGKMGSALGKGGIIGIATAGIGAITGIITKALGSSSIFTGVAAQFWKIAGVMVDMLLMPLLPYMMKFIQWMMVTVMPEIMKVSAGISKALGGDVGPLIVAVFNLYKLLMTELYIKIPMLIGDMLTVWWKNSGVPSWMGGEKGATMKSVREDREIGKNKKEVERQRRKELGYGGRLKEDNPMTTAAIGAIGSLLGMGKKQQEFGENMQDDAAKAEGELAQFVDKEKNVGKSWWQSFSQFFYKGSVLPNIKKDTQGYLENLGKEVGNTSDGLFSWIGGVDWSIFGKIGTMIMDAASGVWGAIKGFFTGKDDDGKEVTPSIGVVLSILNPLEWFPSLGDLGGDMLEMITGKAGAIWGAITGFFTGKDSDGKEVTPSIKSSLPQVPSLIGIITTIGNIKDLIVTRAKDIWHQIKGFFTGQGTTNPGAWDGDYILGSLPDVPKLDGIITALGDVKQMIIDRATAIWTGVKTWFSETIIDKLPKWGTAGAMVSTEFDWGGQTYVTESWEEGTGILGGLSELFRTVMDVGGKIKEFGQKIWDGVFEFFTVTLPGKIPEWSEIVGTVEEVWGTVSEFGGKIGTAVADFFRGLWGSWSGKTGIAGAIPKLMDTLGNLDIMDSIKDLFSMQINTGSKALMEYVQGTMGGKGEINYIGGNDFELTMSISEMLQLMGTKIKDKAKEPITWLQGKYDTLVAFLRGISMPSLSWSSIGTALTDMINGMLGWLNEKLCSLFQGWNNASLGPLHMPEFLKVKDIPQITIPFHTGGIVPGGMNQNSLAVLQGGERVTTRGQSAGGGGGTNQTISITINSNFSPGDIIRSITQSGAVDSAAYLNTVG
jgi:hypothetical protein